MKTASPSTWKGRHRPRFPGSRRSTARRISPAIFFSRGADGALDAAGDHLGIGGTAAAPGRLIFYNGNRLKQLLEGTTELGLKTWYYVVLVRDGRKVTVYLNGNPQPEIAGEADAAPPDGIEQLFLGGGSGE